MGIDNDLAEIMFIQKKMLWQKGRKLVLNYIKYKFWFQNFFIFLIRVYLCRFGCFIYPMKYTNILYTTWFFLFLTFRKLEFTTGKNFKKLCRCTVDVYWIIGLKFHRKNYVCVFESILLNLLLNSCISTLHVHVVQWTGHCFSSSS